MVVTQQCPPDTKLGLKSCEARHGGAEEGKYHQTPTVSLQPQRTDLQLSNPTHSSKAGKALIYSWDVTKTLHFSYTVVFTLALVLYMV